MSKVNEDVVAATITRAVAQKIRAVDGDEAAQRFIDRVGDFAAFDAFDGADVLDFVGSAAGARALVGGVE